MNHFKIGITFSGRYRTNYIEPVCNELLSLGYSKDDIFYDLWHDVLINGIHGDSQLRRIYRENCDCIVVLLSPDYKERHWTGNIEWRSIKELINAGEGNKICLLSVDTDNIVDLDGLYQYQDITKSIDQLSIREIAKFIDQRYKLVMGEQDIYTGVENKKGSKYIKPGFIQKGYLGEDIRPEWGNYIGDLFNKMTKYLENYGKDNPHYEDGMEWHVVEFVKNNLLIQLRVVLESEKNMDMMHLYVFDNYDVTNPEGSICVFGMFLYKGKYKLEHYIPGDWDDKILSWP